MPSDRAFTDPAVPSRRSNPFATCWTAPGAAAYDPSSGLDPEAVIGRLAANRWRGRIVGPHGAGKTALLSALRQTLSGSERSPLAWAIGEPFPASAGPGVIVLAEGFERLGPLARAAWVTRCRLLGAGLVATAHPGRWGAGLPVVAQVAATEGLAVRLFNRLVADHETPVRQADAVSAFRRRGGDLRGVWFDLYDLHERRSRAGRTAAVVESYGRGRWRA